MLDQAFLAEYCASSCLKIVLGLISILMVLTKNVCAMTAGLELKTPKSSIHLLIRPVKY